MTPGSFNLGEKRLLSALSVEENQLTKLGSLLEKRDRLDCTYDTSPKKTRCKIFGSDCRFLVIDRNNNVKVNDSRMPWQRRKEARGGRVCEKLKGQEKNGKASFVHFTPFCAALLGICNIGRVRAQNTNKRPSKIVFKIQRSIVISFKQHGDGQCSKENGTIK